MLEMSDQTAADVFARLPKLARAIQTATGAKGLNILNNNEEVAGQTVFHAHIHIIPRYSDQDEVGITFTEHEPDFEALGQLAQAIASEVKA